MSVGRYTITRAAQKSFFFSRVYIIYLIQKKCEIPISFHVQFNNRSPEALSAPHKSPFSSDQDKCVYAKGDHSRKTTDGNGGGGVGTHRSAGLWRGDAVEAGLPVNIFHPRRTIFPSTLAPINHCDKCSEGVFLRLIFATPTRVHFFFPREILNNTNPRTVPVSAANAPADKNPFHRQNSKSQTVFEPDDRCCLKSRS